MRTFLHDDFDVARLVSAKAGRGISVCLPARNEASTVGDIVASIRRELVDVGVVDEVLVVDDHSTDATAERAAEAGARVVRAAEILPEHGDGHGKGEALWKSLFAATGDIVVWCDADVTGFGPRFVVGLLGPLLTRTDVAFVKGYYDRRDEAGDRGGRVTELVARPLLSLLFPELSSVVQPLSGEYAGRRDVLERLPFVQGYGVDIALLIDVAALAGAEAIAQVDLGARTHRHRPLDELSPQAMAIIQTVLRRAGSDLAGPSALLLRPGMDPVEVDVTERPPLVQVASYRRRTA